ncbi:hypothetical protein HK096_009029, partial [Nowakowskiella sp. JEL0078]
IFAHNMIVQHYLLNNSGLQFLNNVAFSRNFCSKRQWTIFVANIKNQFLCPSRSSTNMDRGIIEILCRIFIYLSNIVDLVAAGTTNRHWHAILLNTPLDIWERVFPGLFQRSIESPTAKRTWGECLARLQNYTWPIKSKYAEHENIFGINGPNQLTQDNIYVDKRIYLIHSITCSHDILKNRRVIRQSDVINSGEHCFLYQPNEAQLRVLDTKLGKYNPNIFENPLESLRLLPFTPSEDFYLFKFNFDNFTRFSRIPNQLDNNNNENPIFMSAIAAGFGMILGIKCSNSLVQLWTVQDLDLSNNNTDEWNPSMSACQSQENPLWEFQLANNEDETNQFEVTDGFNLKGPIGLEDGSYVLYAFEIRKDSVLVMKVEGEKLKIEKFNIHDKVENTHIIIDIDPGVKCLSTSVTQNKIGKKLLICFMDYGKGHQKPIIVELNSWDDNNVPSRMPFPYQIDTHLPIHGSRIKVSSDGSVISYIGQDNIENEPYFVVADIWHQEERRFRLLSEQGIWIVSRDVEQRYGIVSVDFINTIRI